MAFMWVAACNAEAPPPADVDASGLPPVRVSSEPSFVLTEDAEGMAFFGVSARRMPDGSLVVADQSTASIRRFSREGSEITTLARRGSGPGEINGIVTITSRADTIIAFVTPNQAPRALSQVLVYTAGEGYLTGFQPSIDTVPASLTPVGAFANGAILVRRGGDIMMMATAPALGALIPDSARYGIYTHTDDGIDTLVWLPPVIRQWFFPYRWIGGPIPTGVSPYPFGPTTHVEIARDRLWFIDDASGSVRIFDQAGNLVSTDTPAFAIRPFDHVLLTAHRNAAFASSGTQLDSVRARAMHDRDILPSSMPVATNLIGTHSGEVWLLPFELSVEMVQRYVVLDQTGRRVAEVELPPGFDVQQIGDDFVLRVLGDGDGDESVVEFELQRNGPRPRR